MESDYLIKKVLQEKISCETLHYILKIKLSCKECMTKFGGSVNLNPYCRGNKIKLLEKIQSEIKS